MLAQLERFASLRVPAISHSCGPCPVELGVRVFCAHACALLHVRSVSTCAYGRSHLRLIHGPSYASAWQTAAPGEVRERAGGKEGRVGREEREGGRTADNVGEPVYDASPRMYCCRDGWVENFSYSFFLVVEPWR